jgi:hypothetical protein
MKLALDRIYEALSAVPRVDTDRPVYSVGPVPDFPGYFVGKDSDERACLLITVADRDTRHHAPIRLESLEVQFEVHSLVRSAGQIAEGTFTVIRCRSSEPAIIRYFLSVGQTILRILGAQPARAAIAQAVNRLALIFQRLQNPPSRSVNGLFGELFLIRHSRNPWRALAAWRVQEASRFDFSSGDIRLDVKTASGRIRAHTFSYDQCNPPPATIAVVASLFVERAAGGISLRELMREIEALANANAELVMKLHEIVSATLGNALQEALGIRFDQRIAVSSLRFYDLRSIPAIRSDPPAGVSDVHFRSDLSALTGTPVEALIARDPALSDFLPGPDST